MSERIIGYIENGIVIDHIPVGKVWKIARLLGVDMEREGRVSLGDGYESNKLGKKGVIKIEGGSISDYQLNLIALVAENASVSTIRDGDVVNKMKAKIPDVLKGVVLCVNPNCISNDIHERVEVIINYNGIFSCHYCGREFKKEDLKFVDH